MITETARQINVLSSFYSGAMLNRAELLGLAEVLVKFPNVLIVSDEIYEKISWVTHVSNLMFFF